MSAPDLDAIQARLDAATPGPWRVEAHHEVGGPNYAQVLSLGPVECMAYCYGGSSRIEGDNLDADADLIAHAPADLAALLAEVKRLTAERDEARAALAALRGDMEALRDEWRPQRWHVTPCGCVGCMIQSDLAAVLANHPTTKEADRG